MEGKLRAGDTIFLRVLCSELDLYAYSVGPGMIGTAEDAVKKRAWFDGNAATANILPFD